MAKARRRSLRMKQSPSDKRASEAASCVLGLALVFTLALWPVVPDAWPFWARLLSMFGLFELGFVLTVGWVFSAEGFFFGRRKA